MPLIRKGNIMNMKELTKKAREVAQPFCVTKGQKFHLKDVNPGDTNGQGIGGVWFLVTP